MNDQVFRNMRNLMVDRQLVSRGINDPRVLEAVRNVPRHEFIPVQNQRYSYDDSPVPIGNGQTISQPYMVAYMAESAKIRPTDKVLEIGTGCGYSASVLSQLCSSLFTVETIPALAERAKVQLQNYSNIHCFLSDGSLGLPEHAPFDAIVVTAGAPKIPESLRSQLAVNGRMIIPVHNDHMGYEELVRVIKNSEDDYSIEKLMDVRFVPLVGEEGWKH
jgi:protein-L-isoaspartate(D-aspartate) O-methyltransferase